MDKSRQNPYTLEACILVQETTNKSIKYILCYMVISAKEKCKAGEGDSGLGVCCHFEQGNLR